MRRLICLAVLCLMAPMGALAQNAATNPLSATLNKILSQYSKNLIGTAEIMPASKYGYHPTPEEMTFGQAMAHIARVNNFACGKLVEGPAAPGPKTTEKDSKERLIEGLKASLTYCTQAFSKLTDAKLGDMVPFFGGRQVTRLGAALEVTHDLADHYASLAVYLRLNGLLPPTAQKKK
jgi:hypothetical protein